MSKVHSSHEWLLPTFLEWKAKKDAPLRCEKQILKKQAAAEKSKTKKLSGWHKPEHQLFFGKPLTDIELVSMERQRKAQELYFSPRKRIKNDLPIIFADPKYLSLHLLKVIEMAEEVHVISSSFLSLFVCKKYNPNYF